MTNFQRGPLAKKSWKKCGAPKGCAVGWTKISVKFARDWKKSLKIVSLEKNLANEDSDFGSMFLELLFEPGKFATDWKKSMKIVSLDIKIESMIWYEVIWRNWRKGSGKDNGRKKEKKYF